MWANGTHGEKGIVVNTEYRDGVSCGMGHMGDGAHGQWGTWAMGHMGKGVLWLILNIEMGYLGGWGPWVMGQWGTWSMWSCAESCATSLILHGSL